MKIIVSPALVFLILSLAATLVLKFSSPLFVFTFFNTIILAIIVGSYRLSSSEDEVDWSQDAFQPLRDDRDYAYGNVKDENSDSEIDDDDDYRQEDWFSDGYDEDDDDSGSDGEIGWDDDENEEIDDSLRRRTEDFIAKVNKGWREEWLRENLDDQ